MLVLAMNLMPSGKSSFKTDDIISYAALTTAEGINLQRGMNHCIVPFYKYFPEIRFKKYKQVLLMKTYNVTLTRAYNVTIKAENESDAKYFSEFYLSGSKDESTPDEQTRDNFNIGDIEMVYNEAAGIEEKK